MVGKNQNIHCLWDVGKTMTELDRMMLMFQFLIEFWLRRCIYFSKLVKLNTSDNAFHYM